MTYRTLLVHVQSEDAAAPRLACATALADELGAHLIGLGAETIPPLVFTDPYGVMQSEWVAAVNEQIARDLEAAEARFHTARGDRDAEWRVLRDYPTVAMARTARAADLIVAGGAPLDSDTSRTVDTAALVLTAGRPVLIAPPKPHPERLLGRNVVVAWKETRESRRAVADALPLLQRAKTVTVLEVCRKDDAGDAEFTTGEVVQALARHGVKAKAKVVAAPDERVPEEINICAQAADADLIVAGAYGHSRTRELVFGGVTRSLLRHPERFVLMSH